MKKKKFTNAEYINHVAEDIRLNPSLLLEDQQLENNFLNLFTNPKYDQTTGELIGYEAKSNIEIHGVFQQEPHTANIFLPPLYDRVIRRAIIDSLNPVSKYNVFNVEPLTLGAKWSVLMQDIFDGENYNKTASPIAVNEQEPIEVFSDVPIRKLVWFTERNAGVSEAFTSSDFGLDRIVSLWHKRTEERLTMYQEEEVERLLTLKELTITSNGTTSVHQAPFYDIVLDQSGVNGVKLPIDYVSASDTNLARFGQEALTSGKQFIYFLLALKRAMADKNRVYSKGNSDGKHLTQLGGSDGVLIINPNFLVTFDINSDSLYGDKSTIAPHFEEIITANLGSLKSYTRTGIDTNGNRIETMTADDTKKVIAIIASTDVIEVRNMLDRKLSWTNPRALYTNYFSHLWFATLCNPFVPAVRLILNTASENGVQGFSAPVKAKTTKASKTEKGE